MMMQREQALFHPERDADLLADLEAVQAQERSKAARIRQLMRKGLEAERREGQAEAISLDAIRCLIREELRGVALAPSAPATELTQSEQAQAAVKALAAKMKQK